MQWTSGTSRVFVLSVATALLLASVLALGGCVIGQLIGGMAASAEREGSREVTAKYTQLEGKSFAVFIAADRSIQADNPDIVPVLTREISRRLERNAGAGGVYPPDEVLRFQYQRPGWVAMSPAEIAQVLGVDRLVYIDLTEFSLNDPGNPYVWNGVAGGSVSVLESDAMITSEFAFRESIRVGFPDQEGLSPEQIPGSTVRVALVKRFVDRASWLFYDHEEPNIIKY